MLSEVLLPALSRCDLVGEIIVSHGRADTMFNFESSHARIVHRDDVSLNQSYGLARRWFCWNDAEHDSVLSLDDDILLPESSLTDLHKAFSKDPNRLHGVVHGDDGFNSFMPRSAGQTPYVSGAYLAPKSLAQECLKYVESESELQKFMRDPFHSYPFWDGDDIFVSLLASRRNNKTNYAHKLVHRNLGVMYPAYNIDCNAYRDARRAKAALQMARALETTAPVPEIRHRQKRHVKNLIKDSFYAARMGLRKKPSFFILGSNRCGTTALFNYISRHPRFISPKEKELGKLLMRTNNTREQRYQYRRLYPMRCSLRRIACANTVTGEATPTLLNSFSAPFQIKAEFPSARLIVLLRNPVNKIVSMYCNRRRMLKEQSGKDLLPLEVLLKNEDTLLESNLPPIFVAQWPYLIKHYFPGYTKVYDFITAEYRSYIEPCRYAFWLERYLSLFSREQLLVIQSERLFAQPNEVLERVHKFLGLEPVAQCTPALFHRENESELDPEVLSPALRAELTERFKEPNRQLFELLGEEFDW